LKGNPAKIQEFLTISAKKGAIAQKSCIIAGFNNKSNKIGKNDVILHQFRKTVKMKSTFSHHYRIPQQNGQANWQVDQVVSF